MKIWVRRVCAVVAALLALPMGARSAELSDGALEESAPAAYACASVLLCEAESGQILFSVGADERRQAASVVKVMSILLTLEAIEQGRCALSDDVAVSPNAAGMGGSQVLLDAGETQPLEVLLKSAVVGSANDAVVALAEHLYGSVAAFVTRMNERAAELGMADTRFVNTTGLPDEGQYTTARDVARMSLALYSHDLYFDYANVWLDKVVHPGGRETLLTNTNKLLRTYEGCDGGKTGSTQAAGYCMSATASRGGMRLIAVVMGANTGKERFAIAAEAMDYGFANYRLYPVAQKGARVRGRLPVTGGACEDVALELGCDLTLLTPKGGEADIELTSELSEALEAPVKRGDSAGCVNVTRGGRLVARVPVVAAEDVARLGLGEALRRVKELLFPGCA